MGSEKDYIAKYRRIVEENLGWGDGESWQTRDFEKLGEQIFDKTGVSISISTLKRIWGKVKYDSSPNVATLNALARFLDFSDWRAFIAHHQLLGMELPKISITDLKRFKNRLLIAAMVWLIAGTVLWMANSRPRTMTIGKIAFTSRPLLTGVPNTVIFNYDVSGSNADSVAIQQSWDKRRRFKVSRELHDFTSVYYQPGYFRAKLLLNDSVVKEHDLFIETNGWLALIETKDIPVYFTNLEITKETGVGIDLNQLSGRGIKLEGELPWISFFDVEKSKVVSASHFSMEAEIKNTAGEGPGICQKSYIVLLCTNGFIGIPLSIKGCVGEMNLIIGNDRINGQTHDLSAFGVDFSQFQKVNCSVNDRRIIISIHDHQVYEGILNQDLGQVTGTQIRFNGAGLVRKFELK